MELKSVNQMLSFQNVLNPIEEIINESSDDQFIQANTEPVKLVQLKEECIIPSFAKDNESTISHVEFIRAVDEMTHDVFGRETILNPAIRVSHPIKGRIPEAMGKPAKDLLEHEKTLYYERMAFIIEIPSIFETVHDNVISLTIGGVRAYNQENLYSKKTEERFKVFIGFKNRVCTNLCVSTDGFLADLKVRTIPELMNRVYDLLQQFQYEQKVTEFSSLGHVSITEHQFAQIIGKMRLYQYLPMPEKKELTPVPMNDGQISSIGRDYYASNSFCRNEDGTINLWKLYNLFTSANKSSYIDTFLERGVGSLQFIRTLQDAIQSKSFNWFID